MFINQPTACLAELVEALWIIELPSVQLCDARFFSAWATEKHFAAHMILAPSKYQSGKTRKYRKIICNAEAGQILKECVQPLLRSKHNALGAFGRRIAARRGPAVAIKAMARKLAVWIYRMETKGMEFVHNGIKQYKEQQNK